VNEPAIRVTGIGKRYSIERAKRSGRLRDRVVGVLGGPHDNGLAHPTIWALSEVSFEVSPGRVMGVLGRNGSGKSTLLQILARVTAPTTGMAETRGRIGALLQVGAGFHPELSGKDNIALSGAILGMSRSEIDGLRERIVEFAEIGQFLDTPVKHYSSGMYMRLAFSVSAHLPSEIMLVDEVLSVGDAAFQKRCQKRIQELVRDGRTVMLVSHNMTSVRELCHSAIVLDKGKLRFHGTGEEAATWYERDVGVGGPVEREIPTSPADGRAMPSRIR
jgi:lipopolysaccharide transport system ATP-binding protein